MSYWREKSAEVINGVITQFDTDFHNLTDQQKQQLKCAIDASYPFGTRKNHPYQIWLDERRKAFYRLGLANEKLRQKGQRPSYTNASNPTVPGQQSLF
jgi:hypothetical protein